MGTTLTGTTPANTYDSLIKVTDNGPLSGTAKYLSDGLGNDSALALSNSLVGVNTNTPSNFLQVTDPNSSVGGAQLTLEGRATGYGAGVIFASRVDNSSGALVPMAKITGDGEDSWTSTASTQDAGMRLYTATDGSLTEKMRITSAGNVGIGDPSPSWVLDVNNTSSRARFKANTGDSSIELSSIAGRDWLISSKTDGAFSIYDEDASSERMRITSAGNVGIGTSSPTQKLDVVGYGKFSSGVVGSAGLSMYGDASSANGMVLTTAGNLGIGTTSPDSNLHIKNTSGNAKVTIETVDAYDAYINFSGASGEWSMGYDRTSDDLIFCAADNITTNERVRFTSDGITFNGDTAAANALDDYEEGTWTPAASSGITVNTITNATYTKIGNIVTFQTWLKVDITSANFVLSGLPYTIDDRTAASMSNVTQVEVITNQLVGSDTIYAYGATTTNGVDLFIGGNYRVA